MLAAPAFYLPNCTVEDQEPTYLEMARMCGRPVPPQRVYSITYRHDSDLWTATVGERLRGSRARAIGPRRNRIETTLKLEDPAMVFAIFPGVPYKVFTDGGNGTGRRTSWENPFFAGEPSHVTYFST